MRALQIAGAIFFAWISGVGAGDSGNNARVMGALVFLGLSLTCGWCAWRS